MVKVAICIGVFIGLMLLTIKLIRSKKLAKFCDDIESGKPIGDPNLKEAVKDISKVKADLGKKAKANTEESQKLSKESKNINTYLDKDDSEKGGS